ncbi:hypothetical protein ACJX0J_024688, partial [Zea mays]
MVFSETARNSRIVKQPKTSPPLFILISHFKNSIVSHLYESVIMYTTIYIIINCHLYESVISSKQS